MDRKKQYYSNILNSEGIEEVLKAVSDNTSLKEILVQKMNFEYTDYRHGIEDTIDNIVGIVERPVDEIKASIMKLIEIILNQEREIEIMRKLIESLIRNSKDFLDPEIEDSAKECCLIKELYSQYNNRVKTYKEKVIDREINLIRDVKEGFHKVKLDRGIDLTKEQYFILTYELESRGMEIIGGEIKHYFPKLHSAIYSTIPRVRLWNSIKDFYEEYLEWKLLNGVK